MASSATREQTGKTKQDWVAVAHDTLRILSVGGYDHPASGRHVPLTAQVAHCLVNTHYIPADTPLAVPSRLSGRYKTRVEVTDHSTLEAARLLTYPGQPSPPCALNFASATHPGGVFLEGQGTQEENLARSSALYASQTVFQECQAYYKTHDANKPLYTDGLIISPDCPVFRADDGSLLPEPYTVTFITCAAPNLTAMLAHSTDPHHDRVEAEAVLVHRARRVLVAAAVTGSSRLVLGAWGAGAFGHDPTFVARMWQHALSREEVRGVFEVVELACLDKAGVFRSVFGC